MLGVEAFEERFVGFQEVEAGKNGLIRVCLLGFVAFSCIYLSSVQFELLSFPDCLLDSVRRAFQTSNYALFFRIFAS